MSGQELKRKGAEASGHPREIGWLNPREEAEQSTTVAGNPEATSGLGGSARRPGRGPESNEDRSWREGPLRSETQEWGEWAGGKVLQDAEMAGIQLHRCTSV